MLNLNKKFKELYFIICPRTNSFGGVADMYIGTKFARSQKKKIILAVSLFNLHPKHKLKKIYGLYLIFHIFKKLDFLSKIISILLTLFLNFNLILKKYKILTALDFIFFKKKQKIYKYFPLYFGFRDPEKFFNENYKDQNYLEWNKIHNIKNQELIPKIEKKKNSIVVFVKDINFHNLVAEGSLHQCADIENYRESFNLLLKNNYTIERVGDATHKEFKFQDKNFTDNTKKNFSQKDQYISYLKSEFYFGCSGSSFHYSSFFDKPNIVSNASLDYLWNPQINFTKKDLIIFKKVFCKKSNKILSFEEIFNLDLEYLENYDNFSFIENSKSEIYQLTEVFIDLNQNNNYTNFSMTEKFNDLLKIFNKKNLEKSTKFKIYDSSYYMVPNFFLEKYLY